MNTINSNARVIKVAGDPVYFITLEEPPSPNTLGVALGIPPWRVIQEINEMDQKPIIGTVSNLIPYERVNKLIVSKGFQPCWMPRALLHYDDFVMPRTVTFAFFRGLAQCFHGWKRERAQVQACLYLQRKADPNKELVMPIETLTEILMVTAEKAAEAVQDRVVD
jgi:hypothetical protein